MLSLGTENEAALAKPRLIVRDFLSVRAKDRDTSAYIWDYTWSGIEEINTTVIDPETGASAARTFAPGGHLIGMSSVPRVSQLVVGSVTIAITGTSDHVNRLLRTYEPRLARVEIHRGYMDLNGQGLVGPAHPRFVGYIDRAPIVRPANGGLKTIEVTANSNVQDLTRVSGATRSDADQRLRDPNDTFRKFAATIGNKKFRWGSADAA